MTSRSTLQLSRLRDIGWNEWDPIGLLTAGESWEHKTFADEYDRYLLEVAARLRHDWNVKDATQYLVMIEGEHMGLGLRPTSQSRAEATAKAIDIYLEGIDSVHC